MRGLEQKQTKQSIQNEAFYVKKRGLFRRAEQVVKSCNSDVFIIVHQKDTDKIFSFTSDRKFTLEKISELVLRDVQQASLLKKNQQYKDMDFEKVKRNIEDLSRLAKQHLPRGSEEETSN
jgi:hypothetical protein